MEEYRISNLSEYVEKISTLYKNWDVDVLWYRGMEDVKYKLLPQFYRLKHSITLTEEADTLAQFARKAKAFISDYSRFNPIDWYFLMQHHGFPTRLLDWTSGSLIALYFAVRNKEISSNRCVYIINPCDLNKRIKQNRIFCADEISVEDYQQIVKFAPNNTIPNNTIPNLPIAIEPPYIDKRIFSQKSCFTIHGSQKEPLEDILITEKMNIAKIVVPNRITIEIKEELMYSGITESMIFPDLEGLSKELIFYNIMD